MSSIYNLPQVPLVYPEQNPWYDVSSYLINGWTKPSNFGSPFAFWAKVEANEITFYLRTRQGQSKFLTDSLPDELLPPGDRIFGGFMSLEGSVSLLMRANGVCELYAPGRPTHPNYTDLTDGTLSNIVIEGHYVRKPQ